MPSNLAAVDSANPYADYRLDSLYAFLAGYELPRDPGATFEYSNLGVGLLGHALARRAGSDYEGVVRRRILMPLDMGETGITLTPAMRAHLAFRYVDRVVFRLDPANNRSQRAIQKLGAVRAGVRADAYGRKCCVFQITARA